MLKDIREKAGLTQQQLADSVGKDRSTIAKIESGTAPSVETAKAIAEVLKIKWTAFFEDVCEEGARLSE